MKENKKKVFLSISSVIKSRMKLKSLKLSDIEQIIEDIKEDDKEDIHTVSIDTFKKYYYGKYDDFKSFTKIRDSTKRLEKLLEISSDNRNLFKYAIKKVPRDNYLYINRGRNRFVYNNKKKKGYSDKQNTGYIFKTFETMKLSECFKLVKNYRSYIWINDKAWLLINHFCGLKKNGQEKLYDYIIGYKKHPNYNFTDLNEKDKAAKLFINAKRNDNSLKEMFKKEFLKNGKSESELRKTLENKLDRKLKLSYNNLNFLREFYKRMELWVTIDNRDWDILNIYSQLPSDKQDEVLKEAVKLLNIKLYSYEYKKKSN